MKVIEQHSPVVLFIMLYKVVLTFDCGRNLEKVTIEMKATERFLYEVLFMMLYKVVLQSTFCVCVYGHSNIIKAIERYFPFGGRRVCCLLSWCTKWFWRLSLWINEFLTCNHSAEGYRVVISCIAVNSTVEGSYDFLLSMCGIKS